MKNLLQGKLAFTVLSAIATLALLGGCNQETPVPSPTPNVAGAFTGQELPDKVEELEGTPMYSASTGIVGVVPSLKGAPFLLVAPQDPLKALLVVEDGADPTELSKRESKTTKFSGMKETLDSKALVDHVKQRYEMDLQVSPTNQVIVLRVKPATKSPETTSTPKSE